MINENQLKQSFMLMHNSRRGIEIRNLNKTPLLLCLAVMFLSACQNKLNITTNAESPQVAFATAQLEKVIHSQANLSKQYRSIKFSQDTEKKENAGYQIQVKGKHILLKAQSANSLMYAGLELAEQFQLNKKAQKTQHRPYLTKRGLKMNIPLDARTPGYDDTGDAAQNNILTMWDWDFWEAYLDQMALDRYNVLTLWNPHPFPSMIKQEKFPDVALDDVCATTLVPTGKENEWAEPQMVSRNVVEHLKTLKKISIDEKIAFWQKVMQHAHDRGIDIYFFNWNLCANGAAQPVEPFYRTYGQPLWDEKPGKYGINNQMDNPINVAYYRDAVKTFLLTYPHVKGIGITAGEHMMDDAGLYTREQWIWESYGLGILDAKKAMPERKVDVIHRVWNTNMDKVLKYWNDYPDSFEASFKYAKARLYATPTPNFAQQHIATMNKYGLKSWWNLRNDDIYVQRWGDPEYVREFINYFDKEHTAGFYMGSDGYIWAREFNSKAAELQGQLEIEKHWYKFMLWGRLAYNNELSTEFFIQKIAQHYPQTEASTLYKAWQSASKIIPAVNRFHWNDWDYQWSVEACIDSRNGFHDIKRFMRNPTLVGSHVLNPIRYAKQPNTKEISPFQVANDIRNNANTALELVKELRSNTNTKELSIVLDDITSMSYLGYYYANKIEAATELALFQTTREQTHKAKAISLLHSGVNHWQNYAKIIDHNYYPQLLARTGHFDVYEILEYVKKDILIAQSIK